LIDEEHAKVRPKSKCQVERQKIITDQSPAMSLWDHICQQSEGGGRKKGQPNAMNGPYDQKGPERRGYKIGQAGKNVEKTPGNHEVSFGDGRESLPYEGAEDQGGDTENSNKKTNLSLLGSES